MRPSVLKALMSWSLCLRLLVDGALDAGPRGAAAIRRPPAARDPRKAAWSARAVRGPLVVLVAGTRVLHVRRVAAGLDSCSALEGTGGHEGRAGGGRGDAIGSLKTWPKSAVPS